MATVFTRRIIAYVLDFFVVSSFMWIVSYLCSMFLNYNNMFAIYQYFPYVVPVIGIIYFVFCDKVKGSSVGKALMYLRVVSVNGFSITWSQAIIRNLTKIYWFPIIFDWAIGRVLGKSDRILNVFSKTKVVNDLR